MGSRYERELRGPAPQGMALLLVTYVAGVAYHGFADGRMPLDEGMRVVLAREPENRYDVNAIAVRTPSGVKLGYVPRDRNAILARLMDAGWALAGRLERVDTPHADLGRRDENCWRAGLEVSIFAPAFVG